MLVSGPHQEIIIFNFWAKKPDNENGDPVVNHLLTLVAVVKILSLMQLFGGKVNSFWVPIFGLPYRTV